MSLEKLFRKAVEKHERMQYLEAGKLYKKILAADPRHFDANFMLGTLYAESDHNEKAKGYLVKAGELNPGSAPVQVNLGNVYRKQGAYHLAFGCFTRARQLMPDLYQAHLGLGSTLLESGGDPEQAAEAFQQALTLAPKVPEIYQQIGVLLARNDHPDEALNMFLMARNLNPGMKGINSDIGGAYLAKGEREKAAGFFREACRLSPDDIKASYYLHIAEGRTPAADLARKYCEVEFDGIAASFEKRLLDELGYTLPFKIVEALRTVRGSDARFGSIADLGCGTGLAGEALRGAAERLTGIDISAKMIEVARSKNCYDRLHCGDVVTALRDGKETFDLFVATDVLVYLGEIGTLVEELVGHAAPGALFLFSTEKSEGDAVLLQKTGRYAHSPQYIHEVLASHGAAVMAEETIDLRMEAGTWIKGNLFVAQLPAGGQ